jgi:TonB family protein
MEGGLSIGMIRLMVTGIISTAIWLTAAPSTSAIMQQARVEVIQDPSEYGTTVHPELLIIDVDTSTADPATSENISAWDSQDSSSVAVPTDFGILFLRELEGTRRSRRGKKQVRAIVAAGIADGLAAGAKGSIRQLRFDGEYEQLANVEVIEVGAFESVCLLKLERESAVTRYHTVTINVTPPSVSTCLTSGLEHFEKGDVESAAAFLQRASRMTNLDSTTAEKLQWCLRELNNRPAGRIPGESDAGETAVTTNLEIALSYLRLGSRYGTERYALRALALDSANAVAPIYMQAAEALDNCGPDMVILDGGDTIPRFSKEPKLAFFQIPESPVESRITSRAFTTPGLVGWDEQLTYHFGLVSVKARVNALGVVEAVDLYRASGDGILDTAALETALVTRFEPPILCGRAVPMTVAWQVEFFPR